MNVRSQKGFTLLELIIYIGISATLLTLIGAFLTMLLSARIKNRTIAEVESQGAFVMRVMTQASRGAEGITAPVASASAASLTLDMPIAGEDPTIFDESTGTLRITEGVSAAVPLTNTRVTATQLLFQNLSGTGTPGVVRITFTLTHVNPVGRNEYEFSKTFYGTAALR